MQVFSYDMALPLLGLVDETARVAAGWDWGRGAYGHALSLPAYRELHPSGRYSYENYPCAAALERAPILRGIFDSFRCDKVSFRLLRRGPRSAYTWHTDRAKGHGVVRFQLPIVAGPDPFLLTTDYADPGEVKGGVPPDEAAFARFAAANAGRFQRHALEPGRLYYFDTTRVHTLVNPGVGERLTLCMDLVANEWLRARYPEIEPELRGSPGPPRPGALALHAAFARSRIFPLRNWVRRLALSATNAEWRRG